ELFEKEHRASHLHRHVAVIFVPLLSTKPPAPNVLLSEFRYHHHLTACSPQAA
ncbi:hypothetical protein PIB30_082145, partial [Stylosanthes scabra]|nr:hypothetical protein [Stylosanthes scabra]